MSAIIIQLNAGLRRAAFPLSGPRLAGALVGVWMYYALLPLNTASAALGGYAEAYRAVRHPHLQKKRCDAAFDDGAGRG